MTRYSTIAIVLHWLIAALLLGELYVGFTMAGMERTPARVPWINWHKTLGIEILLLTLARLGWRIANPPPRLPADYPRWQKLLLSATHAAFYALLLAIPLTGWAAISGGRGGQMTDLALGLQWPFMPGVPDGTRPIFAGAHDILVKLTIALLALHVLAALKHQFLDRDAIANRMPPFGIRKT
ncbi:MAG TPA: cytochrome b/b6 domain-containing protein [Terricaulis sp.]|nr:cytochrome b/b6 domain-containing protein [Terricaulis sp.]